MTVDCSLPSGGQKESEYFKCEDQIIYKFHFEIQGHGRNDNLINRGKNLMYTAGFISVIGQSLRSSISQSLSGNNKFWRTKEV